MIRRENMSKLIAYYRVSTKKQQASGLGLEAQKETVRRYAASSNCEVIAEYQETESGKGDQNRPQLHEAIEQCELTGAKLVIAKLDRLSRNVAFLANLMESNVQFIACDNPQANELTIHILAAVAQEERRAISQRTKAALAAAKARGITLGNPNIEMARAMRKAGNDMSMATKARQEKALKWAQKVSKQIQKAKGKGAKSLQEIADHLNTKTSVRTSKGFNWTRTSVSRVIVKSNIQQQ